MSGRERRRKLINQFLYFVNTAVGKEYISRLVSRKMECSRLYGATAADEKETAVFDFQTEGVRQRGCQAEPVGGITMKSAVFDRYGIDTFSERGFSGN